MNPEWYARLLERVAFHIRSRRFQERRVRAALQLLADAEKTYGDCAFLNNREVFMAADFQRLASAARTKMILYEVLAEIQNEEGI